ncbi:MAG: hypothetical protein AMS26_21395 [Bacteroides sp. SM23_62]|nr:MAG: hypothetical protein AMS26_21395 [Bacteroides sp. SM23_62]
MNKFYITVFTTILFSYFLSAQTVTLDNGIAKMGISLNGGVITEFSLNAMALNPIHEYGHFICFDRWGPSSPEDQALGIPHHGEASKISWVLDQEPILKEGHYFAEMSCSLPIVKLGLNRKIYLNETSPVIKVVEEISNHNESPTVFNLVQHPTIGAPFLDETTIVDTRVDSGYSQAGNLPPTTADVFTWPEAVVDGDSTDLRYLTGDHTWWQSVVSFMLDENDQYGWVTAVNPSLNLMVGYIWPTAEYPWLNLWLRLNDNVPFARGLEFGSTGLHQPWPEVLEIDTIFGKKMYEEVDVDEKITKSYYAFISEIPSDYKGVESVTIVGDTIRVEEYGPDPGRSIELEIAGILSGQEVIVIEGGPANGGLLETTINGDTTAAGNRINPDRIYELKAGEIYFQHGPIVAENPEGTITIRGQEGGAKPVIMKVPLEEVNIGTNEINSSLAIQNVQYHVQETDGNRPWLCWDIQGNDHHLLVEDCLMEHCYGNIFDLNDVQTGAEIVIRNSYFRDLHDFSQWWGARVVHCKVPVDTFIFENNTVTGGGLTILGQECLFDYSVVNHNTFINNHKYPFFNQYWKEVYFTNNLFVNANMAGEDWENVIIGSGDPDALPQGIMGVNPIKTGIAIQGKYLNEDSTALSEEVDEITDIVYYLADNVVVYSATLDFYYGGGYNDNTDFDAPESYLTWTGLEGPFEVVNIPGIWLNERSDSLITEYDNLKEENNSIYEMMAADLGLGTDPLPQDAADVFVQWNRVQWEVPGAELPADFSAYYFGDYDPLTIPGVETEDSDAGGITKISDLIEDFSYTADLVSKSDGLRIGALHWNDEAFYSEASITAVKKAYHDIQSGIDVVNSTLKPEVINYPNPFHSRTTIRFQLAKNTHVNLSVYDVSGRLVEILMDEKRAGGTHTLQFVPNKASSSTYFYRLTTDDYTVTGKMILLFN